MRYQIAAPIGDPAETKPPGDIGDKRGAQVGPPPTGAGCLICLQSIKQTAPLLLRRWV